MSRAPYFSPRPLDRRSFLKAGFSAGVIGATGAVALRGGSARAASASSSSSLRWPDSLPYPTLPVGQYTGAFPFDHIIMIMQENHSFDNYLGMLPELGQPLADGFTFDSNGEPTNWNPIGNERMPVFHQAGGAGCKDSGSQSWNDTHIQINGGAMDGFATTGPGSMGFYTDEELPFYYSLANTFTVANRWFAAVPSQTTPNRRFAQAATARGIINTDVSNIVDNYPPNGTIWDRLSAHNIPWLNYWSDAPTSAEMLDTVLRYPEHLARIEQFYVDAALGTLPAVSMVDSNMGSITGEISGELGTIKLPYPVPYFGTEPESGIDNIINITAQSEEAPELIQLGEAFVAGVINAVMSGPAWRRSLIIWYYDEHGGYYDHVAPPPALVPDEMPPMLSKSNLPGGYNLYGVRLPAVIVSPYSKAHAVTNVVHDNTSVLKTIEAQWNLPALTFRDANATTLADFLDTSVMHFAEPPQLAAPANPVPPLLYDYQGIPNPPAPQP